AKYDAAPRALIETRDHLRRYERFPLGEEADAGHQPQTRRCACCDRERNEGIEPPSVVLGELGREWVGGRCLDRDHGMLGYPERFEPGAFRAASYRREVAGPGGGDQQ